MANVGGRDGGAITARHSSASSRRGCMGAHRHRRNRVAVGRAERRHRPSSAHAGGLPDQRAGARPGAHGPGEIRMSEIDFHILGEDSDKARLKSACALIEQAFLDGDRVLVWLEDAAALSAFDNLLWTFGTGPSCRMNRWPRIRLLAKRPCS